MSAGEVTLPSTLLSANLKLITKVIIILEYYIDYTIWIIHTNLFRHCYMHIYNLYIVQIIQNHVWIRQSKTNPQLKVCLLISYSTLSSSVLSRYIWFGTIQMTVHGEAFSYVDTLIVCIRKNILGSGGGGGVLLPQFQMCAKGICIYHGVNLSPILAQCQSCFIPFWKSW